MRRYTTCKKNKKSPYEPALANSMAAQTALAERSQQFSEDTYNKYVVPMLDQQTKLAQVQSDREGELFNINKAQLERADARYTKYGIPAEDAYYDMVKKYSAPEQQEEDASLALGDQRVAAGVADQNTKRRLASLGIDPTSPAALAAMTDANLNNAGMEASAQNRARITARQMGMSLTQDAANFGRGGASTVLAFGQAAGANNGAALNGTNAAIGGAAAGSGIVQKGYGIAQTGYGSVMNTAGDQVAAQAQANASASAGFGKLLGTVGGAAITKFSDRRLKKNIVKVETRPDGLGVYKFAYNWEADTEVHLGFMADEVLLVYPLAVFETAGGYYAVDYSKVPDHVTG